MTEMVYPILSILDATVESVLGGSHGFFHVPPGGHLQCDWLTRKGYYKVTLALSAGHDFDDAADAYVLETRRRLEELKRRHS